MEQVTLRRVSLGRIQGVNLAGLTGVVPLARVGPVWIGPGPYEKSSVNAPYGVQVSAYVLKLVFLCVGPAAVG